MCYYFINSLLSDEMSAETSSQIRGKGYNDIDTNYRCYMKF